MIKWDLILKKARNRLAEVEEGSAEEKKLVRIIKFCKFKLDSNIYQREETVIFWDSSEKTEKETKVFVNVMPAKNFRDFCDTQYKNTILKKQHLFNI